MSLLPLFRPDSRENSRRTKLSSLDASIADSFLVSIDSLHTGVLFIQTNWATAILDYKNNQQCEFSNLRVLLLPSSLLSLNALRQILTPPPFSFFLSISSTSSVDLPDVPLAVRTYPASAATAMLPLTPANNWQPTMLFCGGQNLRSDQWVTNWNIAA